MRRYTTAAATFLSAVSLALSLAGLYFIQRAHGTLDGADATGSAVLAISFAVVGGIIVARRGHVIGWIMLISGFFNSLNTLAGDLSVVALEQDWAVRAPAAWLTPWIWSLGAAGFPLVLLLFPSGRPPSKRWWPVAAMTAAGTGLVAISGAAASWSLASLPVTGQQIFERTGDGLYGLLEEVGLPLLGLSLLLSAASLGFRFRAARGVERQELKWLLLGGAVTVLVMFTASPAAPWDLEAALPFLSTFALLGLVAIPVAIGIAITRYQLYDIDVIINRALVYGTLSLSVATVYLGLVVLFQTLLPIETDSDFVVASSTLAAAALFRPLRKRIQSFIDRRFYRRRYDAGRALNVLAYELRNEVQLSGISNSIHDVLENTVQPSHASIWLKEVVS